MQTIIHAIYLYPVIWSVRKLCYGHQQKVLCRDYWEEMYHWLTHIAEAKFFNHHSRQKIATQIEYGGENHRSSPALPNWVSQYNKTRKNTWVLKIVPTSFWLKNPEKYSRQVREKLGVIGNVLQKKTMLLPLISSLKLPERSFVVFSPPFCHFLHFYALKRILKTVEAQTFCINSGRVPTPSQVTNTCGQKNVSVRQWAKALVFG